MRTGPTVVIYPEAIWYGRVQPEHVDEIIESHIVNGLPVERLRIADEFSTPPKKSTRSSSDCATGAVTTLSPALDGCSMECVTAPSGHQQLRSAKR